MKTYWRCDTCRKYGYVIGEDSAGVMEVIHLISDDHHKVSPTCEAIYRDIQITLEKRDEDVE